MSNDFSKTVMYSQLQPWTAVDAPPCMEQVSGPPIPTRVGQSYQTYQPHPWRPTLDYENIGIATETLQPINNLYAPSNCGVTNQMSTDPLKFPNLIEGFEKNPQHAARAALYTRYTPGEWVNNCLARYSESDVTRNHAERLKNEALRVMRETDEAISQGQRDAGRRLGERISDVAFWRNELNTELEKLISEMSTFGELRRSITKTLQDLEVPLHIAQECLYNRENRQGNEKVHDHVEKALLLEIDNLRKSQAKISTLIGEVNVKQTTLRSIQHALEEDISRKESALGIDSVCQQLSNHSRGINYYGGIEKNDPTISTMQSWSMFSSNSIAQSQNERAMLFQLRNKVQTLLNSVATKVWDHWNATNNALDRRSSEMSEAKNKIQHHLHKVQQEIFEVEKYIALTRKAMTDKSNPLKVAHTRLEARSHREGMEMCKDSAQLRIVDEVYSILESIHSLNRKLQELEVQHQQLLKTKSNLEVDLKRKVDALFIDREKCMGLRRSFPVNIMVKY